ncbi:DUF397 domain-containing protein [Streptomyces sp. WAC07061]|uniref:DUF397 domain-containing protein n=1 Tax=Streptomyces sp. WAC07061 TaxID=2487410 RepID=UPI000F76B9F7|nr:DUF397 domain-containing protein [Streptomyces sp. WAC07061]RSS57997.1 DUF397 domain-containing protein [Streptomyces sp. WAC07061]
MSRSCWETHERRTVPQLAWFKSSYSTGSGGECIEVAMASGKSSHSSGADGECLEVSACCRAVHVRDSKDVARASLRVGAFAWTTFVTFATC